MLNVASIGRRRIRRTRSNQYIIIIIMHLSSALHPPDGVCTVVCQNNRLWIVIWFGVISGFDVTIALYRPSVIDSIHARAIIGRKRGLAGIGTKLVGVKLLNTLQQVSNLTSTN